MDKEAYKIDQGTFLRYLLGGSMLGLGAGAGISLANHLKNLKAKQKKLSDTSGDDDTLYVDIPEMGKQGSVIDNTGAYSGSGTTLAASLIAALLGGVGTYNFVRNQYTNTRKNQLQKELDQAQQLYLGDLARLSQKQASQFGFLSRVSGTSAALLALAALGTAATTNKLLSHYYPGYTKPKSFSPKRVVIRKKPNRDAEQGMEKEVPAAESTTYKPISQEDLEEMLRMKVACTGTYGEVDGLIREIARQGVGPVRELVEEQGFDTAYELTKSAAAPNKYQLKLAAKAFAEDDYLRYHLTPIVAADVASDMPHFCKIAATEAFAPYREDCRGIARALSQMAEATSWKGLEDATLEKLAARGVPPGVAKAVASKALPTNLVYAAVVAATAKKHLDEQTGKAEPESPDDPDTIYPGGLSGVKSVGPSHEVDPDAEQFLEKNPDVLKALQESLQAS